MTDQCQTEEKKNVLFHIFVESKGYLEKRHRRSTRIQINDNTEVVIVWPWLFLKI